jgi:hypothetical protein
VDDMAAAPGESLEFLAHVRGWQSSTVTTGFHRTEGGIGRGGRGGHLLHPPSAFRHRDTSASGR